MTPIFEAANVWDAENSVKSTVEALSQLILTPEYFCNKVVRKCSEVQYIEIDVQDDINTILHDKPGAIV